MRSIWMVRVQAINALKRRLEMHCPAWLGWGQIEVTPLQVKVELPPDAGHEPLTRLFGDKILPPSYKGPRDRSACYKGT